MMKSNSGFTLVEVILALVIVGASVSILSHGIINSGRTEFEAKEYTQAAMLASVKMAEIEAGIQPINQTSEGVFNDQTHFKWKITPSATESDKVTRVDLVISFTLSGKEYLYLVTRFINSSLLR